MTPNEARAVYRAWPPDLQAAIREWAQQAEFSRDWQWADAIERVAKLPVNMPEKVRIVRQRNQDALTARELWANRS
jgi:hypothetical protein